MQKDNSHFIINNNKILISPDLEEVMRFLMEIEGEILTLLNFESRLKEISEHYHEILELLGELGKKMKENSIDFNFHLSINPVSFIEKLKIDRPIRSEMIAIFANIEALFGLNIVYNDKIADDCTIRKAMMDPARMENFLKDFCLNKDNDWCINNPDRFEHISINDIRKLRNSLTHFFSVGKTLGVSHSALDEKSRKLENSTNFKAKFLSPEDLYEITKGAGKLIIRKWSKDCNDCMQSNSNDFKDRILMVKSVINQSAPIIIKSSQINI